MRNILLMILLFVALVGCSSNKEHKKFYQMLVSDFPNEKETYSAYIILPPISCVPCNNYSVEKSLELLKQDYPVKVIFECFPVNYPILLSKLDRNYIISGHVEVDTLLKYRLPKHFSESDLPAVVYLKENTIQCIDFQSSANPAVFDNLFTRLKQKQ
jgi:hypothetical protein